MTPLGKAKQLLESLADYSETVTGYSLPSIQYAQTGEPVISCEVATIGVTNVVPHAAYGPVDCNASQLGTFTIIIARDCANTFNDDGTDNPEAVEAVSTQADLDGQVLWDWAANLDDYLSKEWSVAWALVGVIGITTMQLTTGID